MQDKKLEQALEIYFQNIPAGESEEFREAQKISETQDTFCNGASDRERRHRENGTAGEMRLVF